MAKTKEEEYCGLVQMYNGLQYIEELDGKIATALAEGKKVLAKKKQVTLISPEEYEPEEYCKDYHDDLWVSEYRRVEAEYKKGKKEKEKRNRSKAHLFTIVSIVISAAVCIILLATNLIGIMKNWMISRGKWLVLFLDSSEEEKIITYYLSALIYSVLAIILISIWYNQLYSHKRVESVCFNLAKIYFAVVAIIHIVKIFRGCEAFWEVILLPFGLIVILLLGILHILVFGLIAYFPYLLIGALFFVPYGINYIFRDKETFWSSARTKVDLWLEQETNRRVERLLTNDKKYQAILAKEDKIIAALKDQYKFAYQNAQKACETYNKAVVEEFAAYGKRAEEYKKLKAEFVTEYNSYCNSIDLLHPSDRKKEVIERIIYLFDHRRASSIEHALNLMDEQMFRSRLIQEIQKVQQMQKISIAIQLKQYEQTQKLVWQSQQMRTDLIEMKELLGEQLISIENSIRVTSNNLEAETKKAANLLSKTIEKANEASCATVRDVVKGNISKLQDTIYTGNMTF